MSMTSKRFRVHDAAALRGSSIVARCPQPRACSASDAQRDGLEEDAGRVTYKRALSRSGFTSHFSPLFFRHVRNAVETRQLNCKQPILLHLSMANMISRSFAMRCDLRIYDKFWSVFCSTFAFSMDAGCVADPPKNIEVEGKMLVRSHLHLLGAGCWMLRLCQCPFIIDRVQTSLHTTFHPAMDSTTLVHSWDVSRLQFSGLAGPLIASKNQVYRPICPYQDAECE